MEICISNFNLFSDVKIGRVTLSHHVANFLLKRTYFISSYNFDCPFFIQGGEEFGPQIRESDRKKRKTEL